MRHIMSFSTLHYTLYEAQDFSFNSFEKSYALLDSDVARCTHNYQFSSVEFWKIRESCDNHLVWFSAW